MEVIFENFENLGDFRKYNFLNVRLFQCEIATAWSIIFENNIFEMYGRSRFSKFLTFENFRLYGILN